MHKVRTIALFGITFHGQCCRLHVAQQGIYATLMQFVAVEAAVSCILNLICNNTNQLLRLLTDVLGTSILLQIPNVACPTTWRHVGYLVTIDT